MTNLRTTTLRPGFLVSLRTALSGNIVYARRDLEAEHEEGDGTLVSKWETERKVIDAQEHETGVKARSLARTSITRICSASGFGLLCPESRAQELADAVAEARRIADEFNATAQVSRLFVGVIVGVIAQDDVEAVRAINSEVRSLLDEMAQGIRKLDVEAVRDAANRARSLGQMLQPEAAARVQVAIDAARRIARRIVKAGEQAATEIDSATLRTIATARTAFLDIDAPEPVVPFNERAETRALDLMPDPDQEPDTDGADASVGTDPLFGRRIDSADLGEGE